MIITFIVFALLIIGIILKIVNDKMYFQNRKIRDLIDYTQFATLLIGIVATVCVFVALLFCTLSYDVEYQNMLHTRDMLEYRIEHMEENITGNEMLYNDIVEFNNNLRGVKKWANNPWTSWFNNQDIATIDYIDLDVH